MAVFGSSQQKINLNPRMDSSSDGASIVKDGSEIETRSFSKISAFQRLPHGGVVAPQSLPSSSNIVGSCCLSSSFVNGKKSLRLKNASVVSAKYDRSLPAVGPISFPRAR
jgi:hypothetical protein